MKTTFLKSAIAFLILNAEFLISANAQIVYTDVNPDTIISCPSSCTANYNMDLNNDGISDFAFNKNASAHTVHCLPCNTTTIRYNSTISINAGAINAIGFGGVPLIQSTNIDSNSQLWLNNSLILSNILYGNGHCWGTSCVAISSTHSGQWYQTFDKFLAIRIKVASDFFYGWVKFSVNTAVSFTVKEYAYNSIPNQPILAGDTGTVSTGIVYHSIQSDHLMVYPNPATNSVTLKIPSDEAGEIRVMNLLGKTLIEFKTLSELNDLKLDVSDFPAGIYLIQWSSGENFESKTFSIIK